MDNHDKNKCIVAFCNCTNILENNTTPSIFDVKIIAEDSDFIVLATTGSLQENRAYRIETADSFWSYRSAQTHRYFNKIIKTVEEIYGKDTAELLDSSGREGFCECYDEIGDALPDYEEIYFDEEEYRSTEVKLQAITTPDFVTRYEIVE